MIETVRIEMHADDPAARWRATADVWSATQTAAGGPVSTDQYGGYGGTPLEAVTELAKTLAKVVGYERVHGAGAVPA